MHVTFHGVRGSTPCHGKCSERYGGNTSCVSVSDEGADPLLLDLGTGLRYFGLGCPDEPFRGTCLLTHLHWDHLQGLPFFAPLLNRDSELLIYGPRQTDGSSLSDALRDAIGPPTFPVPLDHLPGTIRGQEVAETDFVAAGFDVVARSVEHVGPTNGYRISKCGPSVTYISDHQQPDRPGRFDPGLRDLCEGTDLLIHDSQYTPQEFAAKRDWGHSTIEYSIWLAHEMGAKRLALYHHDPGRTDDDLDKLVDIARHCTYAGGLDVFAAAEGMTVEL